MHSETQQNKIHTKRLSPPYLPKDLMDHPPGHPLLCIVGIGFDDFFHLVALDSVTGNFSECWC